MPRFALLLVLALLVAAGATVGAAVHWPDISRQPAEWYADPEARAIADTILLYQTPSGGWQKNTDMTRPPAPKLPGPHEEPSDVNGATLDNDATTTQLLYLARVITATGDARLRPAFEHGFDYLLAAQYDSGGWPQFFPLRPGYYSRITYNDNAMVNTLTVLRDAVRGRSPYAFVDAGRRHQAAAAVEKGIACILRTQVRQDCKPTVWCAQHDETTFAPAWARNYEPPSLSGNESVGIVRFLMGIEHPSLEVVAAIEGAVAWFRSTAISGLRFDTAPGADGKKDRHAVADPAAPALWARFYELGTNRPIYIGRDRVIRYSYNEIERERRTGYAYLGTWPAKLLEKDYPLWREKHPAP